MTKQSVASSVLAFQVVSSAKLLWAGPSDQGADVTSFWEPTAYAGSGDETPTAVGAWVTGVSLLAWVLVAWHSPSEPHDLESVVLRSLITLTCRICYFYFP